MSANTNKCDKEYLRLRKLSTEELEEMLRADFLLSEEGGFSSETTDFILDILTERDKEILDTNLIGAEKSLEMFKRRYSLDDDTPLKKENQSLTKTIYQMEPKKYSFAHFRIAAIAAVVCSFLLVSVTAYSFGGDVWSRIVQWTEDIFHIEVQGNGEDEIEFDHIPAPLQSTAEKLKEYGIDDDVLPKYLPGDYELDEMQVFSDSKKVSIVTVLSEEQKHIILQYTIILKTPYSSEFEKDDNEPTIINHEDTSYYVFMNEGEYIITWMIDNLECALYGIPEESIEDVIESI